MEKAIDHVNSRLGRTYGIVIGGMKIKTPRLLAPVNPAKTDEPVGQA